ncbi:response regulator transcription factor [Nonomuraea typhae]|uniref:response regulator transcription factor n=1 Tax=Nonomuraea typhae TaxID=2603600 RepID=UPI0012F799CB|nr:response regulator transcription factor [Nonomuraea typhae]
MTPIRLLIADDQELIRAILKATLTRRPDFTVAGEASDGEQAIAAALDLRPDVILMDVRMPGLTGVDATRRILTEWPHPEPRPRVLILTTFDLDAYVHDALRAGASGFMLKNATPDQLAEAVRVVAAGEAMLAPTVTRRLIATFTATPPPTPKAVPEALATLTERELEVLHLLARGLSNAEIAQALNLTQTGVKGRVNRLLGRLGLANRVQAAILAQEHGLTTPPGT